MSESTVIPATEAAVATEGGMTGWSLLVPHCHDIKTCGGVGLPVRGGNRTSIFPDLAVVCPNHTKRRVTCRGSVLRSFLSLRSGRLPLMREGGRLSLRLTATPSQGRGAPE